MTESPSRQGVFTNFVTAHNPRHLQNWFFRAFLQKQHGLLSYNRQELIALKLGGLLGHESLHAPCNVFRLHQGG
jgi:hypothetical protein